MPEIGFTGALATYAPEERATIGAVGRARHDVDKFQWGIFSRIQIA
jgi:hypothetical protein